MSLEIVLASALLMPVSETDEIRPDQPCLPSIFPTLLALAVSGQYLDPRECDLPHAPATLTFLQERVRHFWSAPRLEESLWFAVDGDVKPQRALLQAYHKYLHARLPYDSIYEEDLRDAIAETQELMRIYEAVSESRTSYYYVSVKRSALTALRTALGDEAYYAGRLPPCLPVRHIHRMP